MPATLRLQFMEEIQKQIDKRWHAMTASEVIQYWESDQVNGLSSQEIQKRLEQFGHNSLPKTSKPTALLQLASQFANPLVGALLLAAVVAFGVALSEDPESASWLSRFGDTIAILLIVALNALLGFVQERKAEAALDSLQKMAAPNARVIRNAKLQIVPAFELVPGDIVELEAGDAVPADMRLIQRSEFSVEEAALTGESVPVEKKADLLLANETPLAERANLVFMGTISTRGHARGIVAHTGRFTELGSIGVLIQSVKREQTPLEHRLAQFGKFILFACLLISVGLFTIGILRGHNDWTSLLLTAVSLAVAAIPEGLPAITTITLALGMQRMAQRGALIRKLPAVETLGSATIICSDKTGTLTQNAMTVQHIENAEGAFNVTGVGYSPTGHLEQNGKALEKTTGSLEKLVESAVLCTTANVQEKDGEWKTIGDPTEGALLTLGHKLGIEKSALLEHRRLVKSFPFDSDRKMMSVVLEHDGKSQVYSKGSPDVLLARCSHILVGQQIQTLDEKTRAKFITHNEELSSRAYRVLALARRDAAGTVDSAEQAETDLTFLGLVAMMDPPREEATEAVHACHQAGIRTAMITGDHKLTAIAIARELGMWTDDSIALTGTEIDDLEDQRLESILKRTSVFARVTAEQKLRIVRALKNTGQVVAMTGDGVNDAPALREAQIGVAMGQSGTDVAREAAEMVLKDDNFASIVEAVKQGRAIYQNIQKSIFFLLSSNAGLVIAVIVGSFFPWPQFTPLQLLWINLVTNGLPALALGVDPPQRKQMKEKPRPSSASLLGLHESAGILFIGLFMGISALGIFLIPDFYPSFWRDITPSEQLERARSMAFTLLAIAPLFHAFNCRSTRNSIFSVGLFQNVLLWVAVLASAAVHLVAIFLPVLHPVFKSHLLDLNEWLVVLVLSFLTIPVFELFKLVALAMKK
ncbi:MAG: cation-transporting P-type ATPase [Myxococcales bacterium]|nr:MAG: cation-transporting P-type ATPase [Myxococcales bacterium]